MGRISLLPENSADATPAADGYVKMIVDNSGDAPAVVLVNDAGDQFPVGGEAGGTNFVGTLRVAPNPAEGDAMSLYFEAASGIGSGFVTGGGGAGANLFVMPGSVDHLFIAPTIEGKRHGVEFVTNDDGHFQVIAPVRGIVNVHTVGAPAIEGDDDFNVGSYIDLFESSPTMLQFNFPERVNPRFARVFPSVPAAAVEYDTGGEFEVQSADETNADVVIRGALKVELFFSGGAWSLSAPGASPSVDSFVGNVATFADMPDVPNLRGEVIITPTSDDIVFPRYDATAKTLRILDSTGAVIEPPEGMSLSILLKNANGVRRSDYFEFDFGQCALTLAQFHSAVADAAAPYPIAYVYGRIAPPTGGGE